MTRSRRHFLKGAALAGGALSLGLAHQDIQKAAELDSAIKPREIRRGSALRILILGGTSFLGPHTISYALARGHSISIFTRGRTEPSIYRSLFQHVERLIGDRQNDLEALKGREWDVVIDNSGRNPDWTRDSAQLLKDRVGLYIYTSSTGVYYPYLGSDITESTIPTTALTHDIPDNGDSRYAIMKASSELQAIKAFGEDRTLIMRPTYIIGPGDQSDRFPYWPVRLSQGGEILVPGKSHDPVQFIDVRDLTEWTIRLAEEDKAGTFNVVAPASVMGMHEFVYGAHSVFSSPVSWVHVPDYEFLKAHGLEDLVPWIMPVDNNYGSARANNDAAIANGLTFRPLAESTKDVLSWWYSTAVTDERRRGLEKGERSFMTREADVIAAWKVR
ncbi:MAG: NAD-dependent epimerase/dehydratase family protein [Bacteroidetes bacterium]|nr:MAG: NAD-dependent epimerase/dehydratase family protein [Bacteroidota bacterium]